MSCAFREIVPNINYMRYLLIALFFQTSVVVQAQKFQNKEMIVNKWAKATLNVLCYTKQERATLLMLDSLLKIRKIDSNQFIYNVNQVILSANSGTAIWLTYKKHSFLLSARHVFEDLTIAPGACYNEILIVENDSINSIALKKF